MNLITPYSHFSKIYDSVMSHIDFQSWANFILEASYGDRPHDLNSILDLGCGTGILLSHFPKNLSLKVGLDISSEMLKIARKNLPDATFFRGNLINFQFPDQFDLITSTHDSLNYIPSEEELEQHFFSVFQNLKPGGYYFFDLSSEYNLIKNFHGNTFRETHGKTELIWENLYDPKKKEILSSLLFRKKNKKGDIIESLEHHTQKYYSPELIQTLCQRSGLSILKTGYDYKKWNKSWKCSLINFLCIKKSFPTKMGIRKDKHFLQ